MRLVRTNRAGARWRPAPAGLAGLLCLAVAAPAAAQTGAALETVLRTLNDDDTVKGTEQSKSYRILFDAYLAMSTPPMQVSDRFNLNTIHPAMRDWAAVSDWAQSNPGMAEAIRQCRETNILGMPYGVQHVEQKYRDAALYASIAEDDSLRRHEFPYLHAIDVIAAYATAAIYVELEAAETEEQVGWALELATSFQWVLRQLCDRQFLEEKLYAIQFLLESLSNLRDVMYVYREKIPAHLYRELAWYDLPGLRPDRNRLHIPEGDRVVSEALLEEVFDADSQPDPDEFASAFAEIQSAEAPLTRFGAARRWRMIAEVHGSLEASKERLALIYDDWWRRWRVQEYDPILELETQFERTNPVRYAAVIYSMEDLRDVFSYRNQLIAAVNGTAVAAGLCAYKQTYGVYPDDKEKTYGQFVRKIISDVDPYDEEFGRLLYRLVTSSETIDTPLGRIRIAADEGLLYSRGQDHDDDRARTHTSDGVAGDIVLWPPIKTLARKQGLIE